MGARLFSNACRSVLQATNSTPWMLPAIMVFSALPPPPPIPTTLIWASWAENSSSSIMLMSSAGRAPRVGFVSSKQRQLLENVPQPGAHAAPDLVVHIGFPNLEVALVLVVA